MKIYKIYEEFINNELLVKFNYLREKWEFETGLLSNPNIIYENKYYKEILLLGEDIIPILIKELDSNKNWFDALCVLTGENPIKKENIGIGKKMKEDWIKWYNNKI